MHSLAAETEPASETGPASETEPVSKTEAVSVMKFKTNLLKTDVRQGKTLEV